MKSSLFSASAILAIRELRRRSRCVLQPAVPAALLTLLVCASSLWGQATSSLRGTVIDPSGAAVLGATVILTNNESKIERKTSTIEDGVYQFAFIPPGTYALSVSAPGFQTYERTGLVLLVNTPATVNAQLKLGSASEVVRVSAEEPALDLVDASIGNSFDERQVSQIPLEGRNVPTC